MREEILNTRSYYSLVRSLWYLTCIRPNIAYSVGIVSRIYERSNTLKKICSVHSRDRVTRATLLKKKKKKFKLVGYLGSDWFGDIDDNGNMIFISLLKKQPRVTLLTCEGEYVVS